MDFKIEESELSIALQVLREIPEFDQMPENKAYIEKVRNKESLVLIASHKGNAVACKAGYNRYNDGSFYSWLGGVLPAYRKLGIAKRLADYQEEWAKERGYSSIKFKTLNRHKQMLLFSIKNGFHIYDEEEKAEIEDYKIRLIKELK